MKIQAQRDKSSEGFDPSKWADVGTATSNEDDPKQQKRANSNDDDQDEDDLNDDDGSSGIDNSADGSDNDGDAANDNNDDSGDSAITDNDYELDEKESERIKSEISEKNKDLKEEELSTKIKEAQESRLKELIDEQNDSYDNKVKEVVENLKKENKDLSDKEVLEMAEKKVQSDNDNPFNTLEFDSEDDKSKQADWKSIGSSISFEGESLEIEDNTQEAFQEAINEKIESVRKENEEYASLDNHIKDMVQYVQANGIESLDTWLHPSDNLQKYLEMGDESLVYSAVETMLKKNNEDSSKEKIDTEIESMKTDGSYVKNVRDIRTNLRVQIDKAREIEVQRSKDVANKKESSEEEKLTTLHSSVKASISEMKKYLDTYEIPEKQKANILKSITPELVKRQQTDPQYLAEAIIMRMFGSKIFKASTEASSKKSKDKSLRIRRNADSPLLKKRVKTSRASTSEEEQDKTGFNRWSSVNK